MKRDNFRVQKSSLHRVLLLAGTVCLYVFGGFITDRLMAILRFNLDIDRRTIFDLAS